MSTPIETNTEELQEILNTVYNLPMAGGGSSEPDLVITASENFSWDVPSTNTNGYDLSKILFDPNAVISMYEKHMAGKDVRAVFRGSLYLNSISPAIMTAYPSDRVLAYGADVFGGEYNFLVVRFHIARFYWFLSSDNGYEALEYRFKISSDMSTAEFDSVAMWDTV